MGEQYFTVVFKGDIREFRGNPLKTETPFGVPFICAVGNICDEADELRERLNRGGSLNQAQIDQEYTEHVRDGWKP